MPLIKTDKGPISYNVLGDGPPLVLLRGLGRTVRHWLGYEREVARHFKVITLDLRGMGETTARAEWGTTIDDMAADVMAVLDHLEVERAHLLGVSLGGMVTLAAGLKYPERCASLIVINTSIPGLTTLRLTPAALKALASAAWSRDDELHRRLIDVLVGADLPEAKRHDFASRYASIARHEGLYIETIAKQLVAAVRFRPKRKLKSLQPPTLVIYGTDDRFVPPINSRRLARLLPNAKLVPIAGAGHEVSLDKGEELTGVVEQWIRSCSQAADRL